MLMPAHTSMPLPASPAPSHRSAGQEVSIYDGRPNGELLLATGTLEAGNPAGERAGQGAYCVARAAAECCRGS